MTPQMQELILKRPSALDVAALARSQGSKPMFADAMAKVKDGITTLSEVLRVVEPPREH